MAWLSGGRFKRASGYAGEPDELSVQPLCMDATEVTADAYAACVRAKRCTADGLALAAGGKKLTSDPLCNYGVNGRGRHSMNCVSSEQAGTYCHAQGKRLPDEWSASS